jgi:hypothetical protein
MERIRKQESPVIRLTRWQVEVPLSNKSCKEPPKGKNWTIFGVDAEGNEKVYAHVPHKQFKKWSKTDRLLSQAQKAMSQSLLSNPKTRDIVIKINIQAALKKGDEETAIRLWNALSESTKAELVDKLES